jgi:UDP-2,3-diacylglucosamine hydrolase
MHTIVDKVDPIQSQRLALPFYFLSDNHISSKIGKDQDTRRNDMLLLLEEIRTSKGTLFILGDFFDFWFDKNTYVPPTLLPVVEALKAIVQEGIEIHFIGGNHDFWIKGYLTDVVGIHFYPDALTFEWEGKQFYCHHGDQVVYDIRNYMLIRRFLRSQCAIFLLKILPIKWIYRLGEAISNYNRALNEIPDVPEILIQQMTDFLDSQLKGTYHYAFSGHVHAPIHEIKPEGQLALLGDWIHHRSYGFMDASGFKLLDRKKIPFST